VNVICDLDGVIWLADDVIPGSPEAVAALREAGHRVTFVSNNSFSPVSTVEAKLARFGIPADGDVFTSAQAAASLIHAGERVLLLGGPGAQEELLAAGAEIVTDGPADVVVVGFHRTFDYEALRRAATAIRQGARFIATNDDATYPTPDGPIPGCGSLVAAVETGSGKAPVIAGKPYGPMADVVRAALGHEGEFVMIGDRGDTDGEFAVRLGARFGLVLSGVVRPNDLPIKPTPSLIADDLRQMSKVLLAEG
jgi:HAD superfamily hydrolase (TIGR01450 family)